MSKITGRAKKHDGTPVDYVMLFNWNDGSFVGTTNPDNAGNWTYNHQSDLNCGITYVSDGCEPITHGSYQFLADPNDIGKQGELAFGVGVADSLPSGFAEMTGTRISGHKNYGNYLYSDGSIMCWVPRFYYKWGDANSPRFEQYGSNSIDIKSIYDFANLTDANTAGYAVHRAFYDDGQLKNGFFVDKYLCSNNSGVASSIKNGNPLSFSSSNNPISALNLSPSNSYLGAIDAAKTRGAEFFPATLFIHRALAILSLAQAQSVDSVDNCAWYDISKIANHPKGCNNDALSDVEDSMVRYQGTGYKKAALTGSATQADKTTHNGQLNGVTDVNGVMYEVAIGVTQLSNTYYALKTSAKASALTGGTSLSTDLWGSAGVATNYDSLGSTMGALTGSGSFLSIGNGTKQVFSGALSGKEWQASCAGIPLLGSTVAIRRTWLGRNIFGNFRTDNICPVVSGNWFLTNDGSVWTVVFRYAPSTSSDADGMRLAFYK